MNRREDNIKMGLKRIEYIDRFILVHHMLQWRALVNTAMNIQIPQKEGFID
jgi:hypothetical protein